MSLIRYIKSLISPGKDGPLPPGTKIFIIGRNKTGTKSVTKALADLGFKVGRQRPAELLLEDWHRHDFSRIIAFCRDSGAEVFGDIPFSLPGTFIAVDKAFPQSKFILTMRDDPEQWYTSLRSFHAKLFGMNGIIGRDELMAADYVYKGWMWQVNQWVYETPENDPYNKEILINHYINHNDSVIRYFKNRHQDLLILNPSDSNAYRKLTDFLRMKQSGDAVFPWVNRTDQIEKPHKKKTSE